METLEDIKKKLKNTLHNHFIDINFNNLETSAIP